MGTVLADIITPALRKIGVLAEGEVPNAAQAGEALADLNNLLDQGATERLSIYTTTRVLVNVAANQAEYPLFDPAHEDPITFTDGFDNAWSGAPSGWTAVVAGLGAVTNETVVFQSGGHSIFLTSGGTTTANSATAYRDFGANSGAAGELTIYYELLAGSTSPVVRVQNLTTLKYLASDGSWNAAVTDLFTVLGTVSFTQGTVTFDVEDATTVGASTCDLRVTFYSVGSAGQARGYLDTFTLTLGDVEVTARPVFINDVRFLDTSISPSVEMQLQNLTDDAWAAVRIKDQTSPFPTSWYYNPTFPAGTLTLWPVPTSATLQAAVYIPTQVPEFAAISDTFSLPPAYRRKLTLDLAMELAPSYGVTPSPLLMRQQADAKQAVQTANFRMTDLGFDRAALIGNGGFRTYDIRTG